MASVFCERGPAETALYCSKPTAEWRKCAEAMADIVVNNEYVKANTRKDKRPGGLNAIGFCGAELRLHLLRSRHRAKDDGGGVLRGNNPIRRANCAYHSDIKVSSLI